MKNLSCSLIVLLALAACGGKSSPKFVQTKEENFSKFVNEKSLPSDRDPNLTLDKSIINRDYPIQLALYNDGKFYYDLPNLDDGTGTWSYSGGQIILKSKHRLFTMRIDIGALDANAENLAIKFIDRHGPQTLKMENLNLE